VHDWFAAFELESAKTRGKFGQNAGTALTTLDVVREFHLGVLAFVANRLKPRGLVFLTERIVAKQSQNLASMSVDALLKLRDDIGKLLVQKADDLKRQLARLGGRGDEAPARGRRGRRKSLKGRKVPPKYRGPNGETWAGRGAKPAWMVEQLKQGKKVDDFLIAKKGGARKTSRRKAA
jgi:DNA-binding protein H-NS